jgi:phospholipid-binding lipoprotein MlaA
LAPDLDVAISAAAEADRQDRRQRGAFARAVGDTAGARRIEAGEDGASGGQLTQIVVQALAARADQAAAIVAAALRAAPESMNAVVATVATYFPGHAEMVRGLAARLPAIAPPAPTQPQTAVPPAAPAPAVALAPVPAIQPMGAAPRPATPRPAPPQPAKPAAEDDAELEDLIPAGPPAAQIDDPWEGFNRAMFAVNDGLDRAVLRPVASGYGRVTPDPVKRALRNAFSNLKEPVRFANELLQGEFGEARTTAERFFFNSTIGLGGLFDHASDLGLKRRPADFGQTLHAYGVKSGPYLVLPLLGPSTVRDAIGTGVDILFNPMTYATGTVDGLALRAGNVISTREALIEPIDDLRANSVDFYAAVRSVWAQDRARELARDGQKTGGGPK